MGIIELFEVGFFTAVWNWSNPILTLLIYVCIAIGALVQLVLTRKSRKTVARWSLIVILGYAIILSECVWHTVSGWERLGLVIIYGFIICLTLGAGITTAVSMIRKRGKK